METKSCTRNVPISRFIKNTNLKVDSWLQLIVLCFVFVVNINTGNSQNKKRVDSLLNIVKHQKDTVKVNTYTELFIEYISVNIDTAKIYLDLQMNVAESINNDEFIARTKINYGVYLLNTLKYKEAIIVFDELIKDFDALHNEHFKSISLVNKGNALRNLGLYKEALETHLQALKIKERISNDKENIAVSYWNIGNLVGDIGNIEESTSYYMKSKVLFKALGSEADTIILNLNIAQNLKDTSKEADAIPLFKNAIGFFEKTNSRSDLAKVYEYLGLCYMTLDSLNTSLNYFEKSLVINREYSEESDTGSNLRHIGEIYLEKKKPIEAIAYFKESLKISQNLESKHEMSRNYKSLAEASASLGNYKTAFNHFVIHKRINDTILNAENIERMNELEISYQTEKKEKEIAVQKSEIKLLKEKETVAKTQKLLLLIGIISSLALGGLILYGVRQKMKRNKTEREKLDNDLQFKEKELTTHALHLAHKNEVLLDLKSQLKQLKSESLNSRSYQKVINTINLDINNDNNWEQFKSYFEDVHKDFNAKVLKNYPEVSTNDLRLMSLLKMNLSSKEIANILNISIEGVKKARYRLRKKLNLNTEESLQELVIEL